jgi:hypothetical protein
MVSRQIGAVTDLIAERSLALHVRNIQRYPHVRVKLRRGWRFAGVTGTAHLFRRAPAVAFSPMSSAAPRRQTGRNLVPGSAVLTR